MTHIYNLQADIFFKTVLEDIYTARPAVTNFMSQISRHAKNPDEADKALALQTELNKLKSSRGYADALDALLHMSDTMYGFESQHNMKGYYIHVGNLNIELSYRDIYETGLCITFATTTYFNPVRGTADFDALKRITDLRAQQSPEIAKTDAWQELRQDLASGELRQSRLSFYYHAILPSYTPTELGLYIKGDDDGYANRKRMWNTFWTVSELMPR